MENGDMVGAVATFRDVTAQRQLQRQRDDFLAAISHDLRTPLTTIKGLAQMAARRASRFEGAEAEKLFDTVSRIDATTGKMNSLIGKLLDLMRLQANEPLILTSTEFDLLALLREVIAEQQVSTSHHSITLETELSQVRGLWDAQRVERVFSNLLSNAIKYSPEGGEIVIRVEMSGTEAEGYIAVTIADPGIGIPEDALPHIFDRFYRANNVGALIPGAGLGLTGVHQIVKEHGGSISVRSRLNEGSQFEVLLPLTTSPE
jgi:signal transduction histidine kinase